MDLKPPAPIDTTPLGLARETLRQAERRLRRRQEDYRNAPGSGGLRAELYRAYDHLERCRALVARLEAEAATRPGGAETRHTNSTD